jgi:hypothetical protein
LVFGSLADALGAEIKHTQSTTTMEVGTKESGGILKLNSADGTNAVYIDASQGVGVGTTTIPGKMKITGNVCVEGTLNAAVITGGTGASLWSAGTNIIYATANCVGIGTADPGANNILTARCDQNNVSNIRVFNNQAGTAAVATFLAESDTSSGKLSAYGSTFTTSSQNIADSVLLEAAGTASAGNSSCVCCP